MILEALRDGPAPDDRPGPRRRPVLHLLRRASGWTPRWSAGWSRPGCRGRISTPGAVRALGGRPVLRRHRPAAPADHAWSAPASRPRPSLATVIVQNTAPWTYLGDRPINPSPDASFDRGLDVMAVRQLQVPSTTRTVTQILRTQAGPARPAGAAAARPRRVHAAWRPAAGVPAGRRLPRGAGEGADLSPSRSATCNLLRAGYALQADAHDPLQEHVPEMPAMSRGPYYIDGSCGMPGRRKRREPDKRVVRLLTRPENFPALPLTSREFVKAFTSENK